MVIFITEDDIERLRQVANEIFVGASVAFVG